MTPRRLASLCVALLCAALLTGPAAAAAERPHLYSISTVEPQPPAIELFEDPCGLAVDSAGDIYLANHNNHTIDVFDPSGGYLTQITGEDPGNGPCGLAVDPTGALYVNNYHQGVLRFVPSEFPPGPATFYDSGTTIESANATGIAIDPTNGALFVDDGTYVAAYEAPVEPGDEAVERIGLGSLGEGYGLAVSDFPATAGDVYVADASDNTVKVYDPASDPLHTSALIEGLDTPQLGLHSVTDAALALDQEDGSLYVLDDLQPGYEHPEAVLDRFSSTGEYRQQLAFPIVDSEPSGLAIDDSGGATAGNLYLTSGNDEVGVLNAFGPAPPPGPTNTLLIERTGSGAGAVTSLPAGINCGKACSHQFEAGSQLTLTAAPDPTSAFAGWSGAGCSGTGVCQLTLAESHLLIAKFTAIPQQTLTVTPTGSGIGTVTAPSPGPGFTAIECGQTCTATYNQGTQLTLTATPDPTSAFAGWSGCEAPSGEECEVTLAALREVSAEFTAIPQRQLTVQLSGPGVGTVSSMPVGIDCGQACSHTYNQGTEVTLTATSAFGSTFAGFSGGGCGAAATCTLTLAEATEISAHFEITQRTLTVIPTAFGAGAGSVSSAPAGIACAAACAHAFERGTTVTLSADPAPGSAFLGWGGCDTEGAARCSVTLGADRTVIALFGPSPSASLRLGKLTVKGTSATLAFAVPAAGRVSVSARDLRPAIVYSFGPGDATLHLRLTAAAKRALERSRRHILAVKVTVSFAPAAGGAPVEAARTVIFKLRSGH